MLRSLSALVQEDLRTTSFRRPASGGEDRGPFEAAALRKGVPVPLPGSGEVALFEIRRAR